MSGNAFFNSVVKPQLRELLRETIFCIPSKVVCSLFTISKTTCSARPRPRPHGGGGGGGRQIKDNHNIFLALPIWGGASV